MLVSLRIANFVLIKDCYLEFQPGLNVLTGETGAGKSIVVDALNLLVGERSSSETVRDTQTEAMVEAAFELVADKPVTSEIQQILDECGISFDSNPLIIKRVISPEGRNRIFINNSLCLLKKLREVGALILDLHGQHEHQSLLNKGSYRPLLDQFGGYTLLIEQYSYIYRQWIQVKENLDRLEKEERERKRRKSNLRHEINEIDSANLSIHEEEELNAKLKIYRHAERLTECCAILCNSLCEGDDLRPAILDELDRLEQIITEMAELDQTLDPLVESWQPARIALQEVSRELRSYSQKLEFDPDEMERIQQRRFLLSNLKSKYGDTIQDILQYRETIARELTDMENAAANRESLIAEENQLKNQVISIGTQLHHERKQTAETISSKVTSELNSLGMDKAVFKIEVNYRYAPDGLEIGESQPVRFGPEGGDEVDFLVSTIPGRPPRSLREVASGGEVSRIMLALKCTVGEADPVPTMVFDEIDVGVGGQTAEIIAERLSTLSNKKQVFCITHLPHIASRAECNLKVEKKEEKGRLITTFVKLEGKEKEKELARMLGKADSAASQRYARELLKSSKR